MLVHYSKAGMAMLSSVAATPLMDIQGASPPLTAQHITLHPHAEPCPEYPQQFPRTIPIPIPIPPRLTRARCWHGSQIGRHSLAGCSITYRSQALSRAVIPSQWAFPHLHHSTPGLPQRYPSRQLQCSAHPPPPPLPPCTLRFTLRKRTCAHHLRVAPPRPFLGRVHSSQQPTPRLPSRAPSPSLPPGIGIAARDLGSPTHLRLATLPLGGFFLLSPQLNLRRGGWPIRGVWAIRSA